MRSWGSLSVALETNLFDSMDGKLLRYRQCFIQVTAVGNSKYEFALFQDSFSEHFHNFVIKCSFKRR
jgi:hypothetical protein